MWLLLKYKTKFQLFFQVIWVSLKSSATYLHKNHLQESEMAAVQLKYKIYQLYIFQKSNLDHHH